jgi:hypothetical protein
MKLVGQTPYGVTTNSGGMTTYLFEDALLVRNAGCTCALF